MRLTLICEQYKYRLLRRNCTTKLISQAGMPILKSLVIVPSLLIVMSSCVFHGCSDGLPILHGCRRCYVIIASCSYSSGSLSSVKRPSSFVFRKRTVKASLCPVGVDLCSMAISLGENSHIIISYYVRHRLPRKGSVAGDERRRCQILS